MTAGDPTQAAQSRVAERRRVAGVAEIKR